eukprot:4651158-Pleurochrysis_carterae.AAC.2
MAMKTKLCESATAGAGCCDARLFTTTNLSALPSLLIVQVRRAEAAATKAKESESAARDELEREIQARSESRLRSLGGRESGNGTTSTEMEFSAPNSSLLSCAKRVFT